MATKNPALEAKKAKSDIGEKMAAPFMSSKGVMIQYVAIPPLSVEGAQNKVPVPPVPMFYDENREKEYENPNDPNYVNVTLPNYQRKRAQASIDALIDYGIKLVDELPKDESWIKRLKRNGLLNQNSEVDGYVYDLDDPSDLRFLYIKHEVVGLAELQDLTQLANISPEAVKEHLESF